MARSGFLPVLAAATIVASASALAGAPANSRPPRFTLNLTVPMVADGRVRLEPGDYDVAFEPSPAGPQHFIAVFSRGGARIATAPAALKGAPAGFKVSDATMDPWIRGSFDHKHIRKDGSINAASFEFKVKSSRAFYEALLTEVGMPGPEGESKSPTASPKPTPTKK